MLNQKKQHGSTSTLCKANVQGKGTKQTKANVRIVNNQDCVSDLDLRYLRGKKRGKKETQTLVRTGHGAVSKCYTVAAAGVLNGPLI